MVACGEDVCPACRGELKYYDTVKRVVRSKCKEMHYIYIRRLRCSKCNAVHREIPSTILPFKQYESEIMYGVLEGLIFSDTFGFEDYPCEQTMIRWMREKNTLLYERMCYK